MATKKQENLSTIAAAFVKKLMAAGGLSERKAVALAKELTPVARAAVKKEAAQKEAKSAIPRVRVKVKAAVAEDAPGVPASVKAPKVKKTKAEKVVKAVRKTVKKAVKKVALALGIPYENLAKAVLHWHGNAADVDLLRRMDGTCTHGTYIVAAVRKPGELIGIRNLGYDQFWVKFYPTEENFGLSKQEVLSMGGTWCRDRAQYRRYSMNQDSVNKVLSAVAANAPRPTVKQRMENALRFVMGRNLFSALGWTKPLHRSINPIPTHNLAVGDAVPAEQPLAENTEPKLLSA
jgi:hypothetical protein